MAVFQLLLYQYTGKEDICVAAPFSNRVRKEFSEVIGYFSGNQIIRINFSGNPTLQELLNQVRKIVLEAYSYQEIPSLLAKLKPLEWNDN